MVVGPGDDLFRKPIAVLTSLPLTDLFFESTSKPLLCDATFSALNHKLVFKLASFCVKKTKKIKKILLLNARRKSCFIQGARNNFLPRQLAGKYQIEKFIGTFF